MNKSSNVKYIRLIDYVEDETWNDFLLSEFPTSSFISHTRMTPIDVDAPSMIRMYNSRQSGVSQLSNKSIKNNTLFLENVSLKNISNNPLSKMLSLGIVAYDN